MLKQHDDGEQVGCCFVVNTSCLPPYQGFIRLQRGHASSRRLSKWWEAEAVSAMVISLERRRFLDVP